MALAPALALAALAIQPPQTASVHGRVFDAVLNVPVPSAVIALEGLTPRRTLITSSDGRFRFDQISAGAYTLRVERSGYRSETMQVRVSDGATIEVELGLDLQPLPVAELSIRVQRPYVGERGARADPADVVPRLARADLVRGGSPVAELGLANLARDVRGQDPGDPSDLLYVRGSALDLKLVLLDGAPVYTPFHVGGLLEPLEATSLSAARLHIGAAPARLNGGLSYILDLRTRAPEPNYATTSGSVDLLAAKVMAEAPVGSSAGVLAMGRVASGDAAEALLGTELGYAYRDGLVRAGWRPDPFSSVRLTAFANREAVQLGEGLNDAAWGSAAVSAAWDRTYDAGSLEVGASLSRADGRIPRRTGLLDDLESRNIRVRAHADGSRRFGSHAITFGTSVERESLREDPDSIVETVAITTWSGYGEVDLRASEEMRVRGGLRFDVDQSGAVRPAPRIGASWLLSEKSTLSITAGSYHQYVRDRGFNLVPGPLRFGVARASHVAISLDQEIAEQTRLELQGYLKRFTDLPDATADQAYTSGIDLWAYRDRGALTAWLGYSLAWLWSQPEDSDISQRFSAHQVLSLGMRGRLGPDVVADLTLTYGSGLPLTGIDISSVASSAVDAGGLATEKQSSLRPPPSSMIRLDARIARTWAFERGDRSFQFTPYFKLLNALDRRDALFFYDDNPDPNDDGRPLATLPLLPLLGIEWRF